MMVKIIYKDGKNLGLPNWRIKLESETRKGSHSIIISTENFKHGFNGNESWDKVYAFRYDETYSGYISVITNDYNKLESFRPIIIEKFYETSKYNIKKLKSQIKEIEEKIQRCDDFLKCDLFKDRKRDEKLDELGI